MTELRREEVIVIVEEITAEIGHIEELPAEIANISTEPAPGETTDEPVETAGYPAEYLEGTYL